MLSTACKVIKEEIGYTHKNKSHSVFIDFL